LVEIDTTSGHINSRVCNYEHGNFQIRNKNPLNLLQSGYWGKKQNKINKMKIIILNQMEQFSGGKWTGWTFAGCWLGGAAVALTSVALGPIGAAAGALTYASCLGLTHD
jgi:hypothetical protein